MTPRVSGRQETTPLSASHRRLLIEIGFLAAGAGDVAATDTIFAGLAASPASGVAHLLGPALARLNAGRAEEALVFLVEGGAGEAALAPWRVVALRQAGRLHESQRLLCRLTCDDTPTGRLTAALKADAAIPDAGARP